MKFSNFGSIVKTYKKNFLLRKEKFLAERKAAQVKKKKDREDLIEAKREVAPLIKLKGKDSKKLNFLGDIKKFLGFVLAGFVLQNIESIIRTVRTVYKKIEEIVKGTQEFIEGIFGGVRSFFEGLDEHKKKFEDLIAPIKNADITQFLPFQNQFEAVLGGVLSIAALITGLYQGKQQGGDDGIIDDATKGAAAGVDLAAQRKAARLKAIQEAKALRAEKQKARIKAREVAEAKAKQKALALKRAAAMQARITEKLFGKQTPVTAARPTRVPVTPAASTPITPGGSRQVPATDANLIGMMKESLKNKSTAAWQKILDDPKADSYMKSAARELIEENLSAARLIDDFTPEELKARSVQDQGKPVPQEEIKRLGDEARKRSTAKGVNPQAKAIQDFYNQNTPKLKTKKFLKPEVPTQGAAAPVDLNRFNQIMKNARGFIKPSNLTRLAKFGRDLGIGVLIEFAAGWAIDRGLEAVGLDEKSLLEERVLKFNRLPLERQKEIIEKYNENLEKELKYQETFFAKVEKVIALGDMTLNERKIKSLAGFLTAVSISGAPAIYDLATAKLPDYLGDDVELEMLEFPEHFADKVKPSSSLVPSILPPLPPTGTLGTGAQAYGASRPGGRKHAGVDFDPADDKNSKFYSRIGGEVIYAANAGGGYGNVVDIYNAQLGVTERIAEGNRIHVKVGDIVKPGTLVQSGSEQTGVFHYEIRKGKAGHSGAFEGTVDPLKFLESLKVNQNQASIKTSPSSLISSAGLDQSTSYSESGMSIRREVNNIFIPITSNA